jgi:hypothetical protein
LCEPSEKREEIRFADLTGADNIFSDALGERKRGEDGGGDERETRLC